MSTEWRAIPGFPKYEAGSNGQIRSLWFSLKKPLIGGTDKDGYIKAVFVQPDGRRVTVRRSVAVLLAFCGPRPPGMVCRHLNGSRTDDRPVNLAWSSQKDNIGDKVIHGTAQRGEQSGLAKITSAEVLIIREEPPTRGYVARLTARFGVSRSTIYAIRQRRKWAHLP